MFNWIKSRQENYNTGYRNGYKSGEINATNKMQVKIDLISADRKKSLKEKNKQIKERDKKIKLIESDLHAFRIIVTKFEHLIERLGDSKQKDLLNLSAELQQIHRAESEISSIVRAVECMGRKIEKRIDDYDAERLN